MAISDGAYLDKLYEFESEYWWSVGMRRVTRQLLARFTTQNQPLSLVEVGCGGGLFLNELSQDMADAQLHGFDLNPSAVTHASEFYPHLPSFSLVDMHQIPYPANSFDVVVGQDVFDQIGVDMVTALKEAHRVLRPNGIVLLRVSAYSWLASPHDKAFGTGQRYNTGHLKGLVREAGYTVQNVTHANAILLLPAIIVRLANRFGLMQVESQLKIDPFTNKIFLALLALESKWLRWLPLPFGLSLYIVGRKD